MPRLTPRVTLLIVLALTGALTLTACDVFFDLDPLPTPIVALPTFTPSYTPPPPTPTIPPTSGSLLGRVWQDRCPPGQESTARCVTDSAGRFRGNGIMDADEVGIGGVTVSLGAGPCLATGLAEAVTGPDGIFRFENLSPGNYCLSIDPSESAVLSQGVWTAPTNVDEKKRVRWTTTVSVGVVTENLNFGWDDTVPPTPTITPTPTISLTPSVTPTSTRTPRPTSTRTPVPPTVTLTRTVTNTPTITFTPTASRTLTATPTGSVTATSTATATRTTTATATATHTPTATASVTPTTTVTPVRGVTVAPGTAAQSGNPGAVVIYNLTVTNTGAAPDSFTVALSGAYSPVANPPTINSLAAGASASLDVSVVIPSNAAGGSSGITGVTVTSQGDPTKSALATLTTTVNNVVSFTVTTPVNAITSTSPSTITYTLTLTNQGNFTDSYTISASTPAFATTIVPFPTVANVAAGANATITVEVMIPGGQSPGTQDTITLTFASQASPVVTADITLTTTVGP